MPTYGTFEDSVENPSVALQLNQAQGYEVELLNHEDQTQPLHSALGLQPEHLKLPPKAQLSILTAQQSAINTAIARLLVNRYTETQCQSSTRKTDAQLRFYNQQYDIILAMKHRIETEYNLPKRT